MGKNSQLVDPASVHCKVPCRVLVFVSISEHQPTWRHHRGNAKLVMPAGCEQSNVKCDAHMH